MNFISRFGAPQGGNREIGRMPMRSRRCNAEEASIRHWETGKARRTMMQSQKTYRISYAGRCAPWGSAASLCILRWTGRQAFFV